MSLSAAMELDAMTQALLMTTDDHAEFHAAFNAERPPEWTRAMIAGPDRVAVVTGAGQGIGAACALSDCRRPGTGSRWSAATTAGLEKVAAELPGGVALSSPPT